MYAAFCLVLATVGAALVAISRRIAPGPGLRAALVLPRLLVLAALGLLVWKAFRGGKEVALEGPTEARAAETLVLQDMSLSMDLLGGPGKNRGDLAESVWSEVREKARGFAGATAFPVSRIFFAENLAEEGRPDSLLRDGTFLRRAAMEVLSRRALRSLLIVSDGISTDGIAPPYLLDWARNRGIRVNAVLSADPGLDPFDLAVQDVACERENPSSLAAKVLCTGSAKGPIAVALSIDGSPAAEAQRGPEPVQEVPFRLPPLEPGWHEYAVEVRPLENEATPLNNAFHGVFRIDRERILLIHERPRIEHVHLARHLRKKLEGKLTCLPAAGLAEAAASLRLPSLVILADVAPQKIPAPLRDAWASARVPLLILGGDSLEDWAKLHLPGFPLAAAGAVRFLGEGKLQATVTATEKLPAVKKGSDGSGLELPLDLIQEAKPADGARVALGVKIESGVLPLLVLDPGAAPRIAILLTDTTYKWSLHPDTRIRQGYNSFWSACLDLLLKAPRSASPLVLDLQPPGEAEEDALGRVAAADPREGIALANCRVKVEGGDLEIRPEPEEGGKRYSFRLERKRLDAKKRVLWLQAFAEVDGREASSERVPLVLPGSSRELRDVLPDAEALQRHTTGERDGFSWFPGRAAAIDSLFREERPLQRTSRMRKRDTAGEIFLAGCAVLFLAIEWWIERKQYAGSRP